jgi:predicted DNA-binding transcriptional regulator AlpA
MNLSELITTGANVTVSVTPTDLKNFANDLVNEIIAREKPAPKQKEKLLTTDEVCEMLSISRVTAWQWDNKGIIKPIRIGNLKRYRLSDIETIIKRRGVE